LFDPVSGAPAPFDPAAIREDVSHAFMREGPEEPMLARTEPDVAKARAYSFAKAPRLAGRPAEVGAIARLAVDGHALTRALLARSQGSNVAARVVARAMEIALITRAAEEWARSLSLNEPFCAAAALREEGQGMGLVEAARGSLGHWMSVSRGNIRRYQIISPTGWNFSPRDAQGVPGPLEQALEGAPLHGCGARAVSVQHIVRSFDPCMVCTAH